MAKKEEKIALEPNPAARLEIKELCRQFGKQMVVDRVSLRIQPGRSPVFWALLDAVNPQHCE